MNEMKLYLRLIITMVIAITVGVLVESGIDAWKAVETSRLRCAPSAAPSGSAP